MHFLNAVNFLSENTIKYQDFNPMEYCIVFLIGFQRGKLIGFKFCTKISST